MRKEDGSARDHAPSTCAATPKRAPLKVLDLFSGIGGFSLGLERTGGFETVAFCEIEPYARQVLAKHWPEVPCFDDVRTLTADALAERGIAVDVICGGFPCQDISIAWNGPGIEGARSGLWSEYSRLIGELRPSFVIVENVGALLSRGLGRVLGDLAALGYDAEWNCIPATYVGAPHRRDRLWIVAYPHSGQRDRPELAVRARRDAAGLCGQAVADADQIRRHEVEQPQPRGTAQQRPISAAFQPGEPGGRRWWQAEPAVGRVADGVPNRVDRIGALGNAVVPAIPELIGRAILTSRGAADDGGHGTPLTPGDSGRTPFPFEARR